MYKKKTLGRFIRFRLYDVGYSRRASFIIMRGKYYHFTEQNQLYTFLLYSDCCNAKKKKDLN